MGKDAFVLKGSILETIFIQCVLLRLINESFRLPILIMREYYGQ